MDNKIFVLGDSRTGTTSLHKFFMDAGISSVHYFVDELQQTAKEMGAERPDFTHFQAFVENSGFQAFSDYPTRNFFRALPSGYPEAYYILSTRKSPENWRASMIRYFADRPDVLGTIDNLTKAYLSINEEIRTSYKNAKNFIEICIEDGNEANSQKLSDFLGFDEPVSLKKLNATK